MDLIDELFALEGFHRGTFPVDNYLSVLSVTVNVFIIKVTPAPLGEPPTNSVARLKYKRGGGCKKEDRGEKKKKKCRAFEVVIESRKNIPRPRPLEKDQIIPHDRNHTLFLRTRGFSLHLGQPQTEGTTPFQFPSHFIVQISAYR